MNKEMEISIKMNSLTSKGTIICLNGEDISRFVNGIKFELGIDSLPVVIVSFAKIKMSADLIAQITHNLGGENAEN